VAVDRPEDHGGFLDPTRAPLAAVKDWLPAGPWELAVFATVANGVTVNRDIHARVCGPEGDNCRRRVREAIASLRRRGLVYRKRNMGQLHTYLTRRGKYVAMLLGFGCEK